VPTASWGRVIACTREGWPTPGSSTHVRHIGNNHVHVNIIPAGMNDYEKGKALYLQWARAVIAMGAPSRPSTASAS